MKCRANRRDYNYNTAYDAGGNLVSYDQGNIGTWLLNSGTVVSVDFARSPNLSIGDYAFSNCGIQGDLAIPDNFISIGRNAFQGSDGIKNVYINIPEENIFNGSNEQSPFYNGPVGKLYVTSQYILEYGGVGAFYPPVNGMEVALWADHKDSVVGEEVNPDYTISTPVNSVEEGISSVVTVNTTSVVNGTTLYWTLSKPSEFSVSSGSFTINNNIGTFNITPLLDQDVDPAETFDIQIRTGSTSGPIVESKTITINDKTPTYTITANSSVDENSDLFVTINTENFNNNTLYWAIDFGNVNTTAESADFDQLNGTIPLTTINATQKQGTFQIPIKADGITDAGEYFVFDIKTDSVNGTTVDTSNQILINDIANPPDYTITPAANSVDEGQPLQITLQVQNVSLPTTLHWSLTNPGEFDVFEGEVVMNTSTEVFNVTPKLDNVVNDSVNSFQVKISETQGGQPVKTSSVINIIDKTKVYTLVHNNNVDEGLALNVTLNTTNVADQTLYWVITSNAGDFSTSSGSFSLISDTGSFTITPDADSTTEGVEQFFFVVKTGSINGTTVASSSGVTINDTSQDPGGFTPVAVYRVNCGGSLVSATDGGIDWIADDGSLNDGTNTYDGIAWAGDSSTAPPPSYVPKAVFKADRYGTHTWTFGSLDNANYDVNLGFSENFNIPGTRLFDVNVNGVLKLDDYNRKVVGDNQLGYASWQSFPISVSNNQIEIDFINVSDNAAVNVIEIVQTTQGAGSPTYAVAAQSNTINEGSSLIFDVTTTNVSDQTLYWSISGDSSQDADFVDVTGSFQLINNAGQFTVTAVADSTTEAGAETFYGILETGIPVLGTYANYAAQSQEVTINDTSQDPQPVNTIIYGINDTQLDSINGNIPNDYNKQKVQFDVYSIEIGSSCSIIGDEAFFGNNNITEVDIPSNVTSVLKEAFKNCTSLTTVTINIPYSAWDNTLAACFLGTPVGTYTINSSYYQDYVDNDWRTKHGLNVGSTLQSS